MKNIQNFDDFMNEKKKMNPGFAAYLAKKSKKKDDSCDDDSCDDKEKKSKKKDDEDEDDDKPTKGLTAKQKRLPIGLQKAILKRQKK